MHSVVYFVSQKSTVSWSLIVKLGVQSLSPILSKTNLFGVIFGSKLPNSASKCVLVIGAIWSFHTLLSKNGLKLCHNVEKNSYIKVPM